MIDSILSEHSFHWKSTIKKAKFITLLKPNQLKKLPEVYRSIALLSSCYKLLEIILLNNIIGSIILGHIPIEQVVFRPHQSGVDQILSQTLYIDAGIQRCLKTTAVFVDFTAAYDIVWRESLLYKFHKEIPSGQIIQLINNMLSDRCFQIMMGDTVSKMRKLNTGFSQGLVHAPVFFNIYIFDIPKTNATKFD